MQRWVQNLVQALLQAFPPDPPASWWPPLTGHDEPLGSHGERPVNVCRASNHRFLETNDDLWDAILLLDVLKHCEHTRGEAILSVLDFHASNTSMSHEVSGECVITVDGYPGSSGFKEWEVWFPRR